MAAKVVDASIIAAIAFGEPRADEAEVLLSDSDLSSPPLMAYELASVARKKARQHPSQIDAIAQALAGVLRLDIHWVEVDDIGVFYLALETGLTTYDATYTI